MKVQAILLVLVLFVLPVVITSPKNYVKLFHYITSHVGAWLKNYYQRWNDDSSGLARSEVLLVATVLACVFVVPYASLFARHDTPIWDYLTSLIVWEERRWDRQSNVMAILGLISLLITVVVAVISCLIQSHFIKPNQIKLEQQ